MNHEAEWRWPRDCDLQSRVCCGQRSFTPKKQAPSQEWLRNAVIISMCCSACFVPVSRCLGSTPAALCLCALGPLRRTVPVSVPFGSAPAVPLCEDTIIILAYSSYTNKKARSPPTQQITPFDRLFCGKCGLPLEQGYMDAIVPWTASCDFVFRRGQFAAATPWLRAVAFYPYKSSPWLCALWSLGAVASGGCCCRVLLPDVFGHVRFGAWVRTLLPLWGVAVLLSDVYGSVHLGAGAAATGVLLLCCCQMSMAVCALELGRRCCCYCP